ncbi:MAG: substrate-binding domain-containing protein [Treponema sp.]|jgi:ABC-type sugar transport system substrate-binding protein|nr:substrate-binding domain-containing protein [Treponema sp.]
MRKIRKAILGIVVIAIAMMVLAGCSKKEETSSSVASTTKKYTIGILSKNQSDTFVRNISDAILARAEELKDECTVIIQDAEGEISKQIQQAEDFITQRVDAIVLIAVDYEGCAPIVDMALEAGITIVGDNTTTPNMDKITYVGSDDTDAGRIQAEYLRTVLKPGARIVYLEGPIGLSPQIFRRKGLWENLIDDPAMRIEVLDAQTANWKRDQAMTLTENWLTRFNNNIDAVVSQNDDMALGALEAVEAKGLKDRIIVIGVDAIADALTAIKAGRLDATVFQDAVGQGRGGLDVALELLKTGQKKIPDQMIPFKAVTKENVDQFM